MLVAILLRLGVGLLVLLALFGLGQAFSRRLALRLPPFQSAAVGLALFLLIGGLLGTFGFYGKSEIAAEIVLGDALGIFYLARRAPAPVLPAAAWLSAIPFFVAGVLVLLTAQHGYWFIQGDDMQGYLPLIKKLADTGQLGNMPFSEKRMWDLGGISILQAVFVDWFGVSAVNLADLGIGGALVLGLIGEQAVFRRYGFLWSAILVLAALLINADTRPVSSVLLIESLCLFLGILLLENVPLLRSHYVVWGLVAAALISLKSTSLVFLAILSLAIFLIGWTARGWKQTLGDAAVAAGMGAGCLLPFLYTCWKYYGTPLYPVFRPTTQDPSIGDGLFGRSQATLEAIGHYILANQQLQIVLVIAAGVAFYGLFRKNQVHLIRNLAFAAALAVLVFEIVWAVFAMGEYDHGVRYALPFYAAILLALLLDWRIVSLGSMTQGRIFAAGILIAIPWCAFDPDFSHPSIGEADLVYGLTGSAQQAHSIFHPFPVAGLEDGQAQMERMQSTAVPGSRMLVFIDRPYELNFARNRIETADCPGRVSPPPGLPLAGSDDGMISYLRAQGVRYLAYSYGDDNSYAPQLLDARMKDADHPYAAYCSRGMARIQGFLLRMRQNFRAVYDDGETFLIDLDQAVRPGA